MNLRKKISLPKDLVLGVTYGCNSRCVMCDIWKMKPKNEVQPNDLRSLPDSFRDINISGGEPFLRRDLVEMVRVLKERCPKAQLVISSNGFLPELIEQRMKEILAIDPAIGIGISIDGSGAMHEKIRRIPYAYEKSILTIRKLQGLGMTNIRIAFTIVNENIHDLVKMHDVAKEMGVDFTLAYAQSSHHYFGGIRIRHDEPYRELEQELLTLIARQLSSHHPKQWLRAYFSHGILEFAKRGEAILPTVAGVDHCYIDSWGNVFPSVSHSFKMGNLREEKNFDKLWRSEQARIARKGVSQYPRSAWMICTARSAMKRHLSSVGWWILKNKIKNMV